MAEKELLISRGNLGRDTLAGQIALVTGAGRGIGFEAARALAWLGARVVLAETKRPEPGPLMTSKKRWVRVPPSLRKV